MVDEIDKAPVASVEDVLAQKPKQSTYKTIIANPYLFGVALVSNDLSKSFFWIQSRGDMLINSFIVLLLRRTPVRI
jgi:hypothetical protein